MKSLCVAFLLILAAMVSFAEGAPAGSDELRADIDFAKSKVYPALVNIQVVGQSFSGWRSRKFPGAGSGVIVSPAGHVLTNYHVAGETTRIVCTLPDGETIQADVVAHDPLTDLSVLKLRMEQRKNANTGRGKAERLVNDLIQEKLRDMDGGGGGGGGGRWRSRSRSRGRSAGGRPCP